PRRCRRRSCASDRAGRAAGRPAAGGGWAVLVRIGSRGSRLALTQAELAASVLRRGGHEIAFVPITTAGDRDRSSPFGQIGERGVFVKEIEEALLSGRIDVAVHSAKDMTSTDNAGLPEAAQGALALQVRAGEEALVADGDAPETRRRVEAERACVASIGAGCLAPVAAHHDGVRLEALIAAEDGSWVERRSGGDVAGVVAALLAASRDRAAA